MFYRHLKGFVHKIPISRKFVVRVLDAKLSDRSVHFASQFFERGENYVRYIIFLCFISLRFPTAEKSEMIHVLRSTVDLLVVCYHHASQLPDQQVLVTIAYTMVI